MRKLGNLVLLSRIASGTLGDVFLARRAAPPSRTGEHPAEEADFAVKLIRPELSRDLRFLRLLFTEAPAALRFTHRAAARVLAVERDAADVYLATELAHGQPLSQLLKRAQLAGEPLDQHLVCYIAAEIASVLAAAHATPWFAGAPSGMIHGGISPRSVLITYQGEVKVLGAGSGRARLSLPISSARLGYAAPETLMEKEPTPRIDTYALGVVAHEAITGRPAYRRATDDETREAIREARLPPINPLSLKVKHEIGDLIAQMTVFKPEARIAELSIIEHAFREASAGTIEVLSAALEERMRALFSGEIRAERRVVAAAHRQASSGGEAHVSADITLAEGAEDPTPELRAIEPDLPTLPENTPAIPLPKVASIELRKISDSADGLELDPPRDTPPDNDDHEDRQVHEANGDDDDQRHDTPSDDAMEHELNAAARALAGDDVLSASIDHPPFYRAEVSSEQQHQQHLIDSAALAADLSSDVAGFADHAHATDDPAEQNSAENDPAESQTTTAAPVSIETNTLDLSDQRRIARYQTQVLMKRTASTAVFRAKDPNVSRSVLLKAMSPDFITDPRLRREEWVTLFKREARMAGKLSHPLIPTLFDAGRDGGFFFIVYSLVEGEPLSAVIERGEPIPTAKLKKIISDVATALAHMHSKGVVHCDVRASNVVLDLQGAAHLVDFSMASEAGGPDHPLLASNAFVHSPEYLKGYGYGPPSDQFALGQLVYQLLAGVRPFRAIDDRELTRAVLELAPRPPIALDPRVDPALSELAMRMLEKDPARRFAGCGELVAELNKEELKEEASVLDASTDRIPREVADAAIRAGKQEAQRKAEDEAEAKRISLMPSAPVLVLIDEALDSAFATSVLSALPEQIAVFTDFERGMKCVENYAPRTVIISEGSARDPRLVRRWIEQISRDIELRFVPDLPHRLLGSLLDANDLASALISALERTGSLVAPVDPLTYGSATQAARALAVKLGAGPRAELLAPLSVAARELAGRMRLSATAEEILALVPPELGSLFAEIDAVLTDPEEEGGPTVSLLAQIVAVVEAYFNLTRPVDGRPRASPRKAITDLVAQTEKRVAPEVLEALIEHLREVVSAVDVSPLPPNQPKIVIAGDVGNRELVRGLEADGFAVEHVETGQAAFEALRKDQYAGAIVDRALPGRDALSLLRLCRSHPDTREAPLLILCAGSDPLLEAEVARAGKAEILERSAATDVVRARVGRLMR